MTRLFPLPGGFMHLERAHIHLGDRGPITLPLPAFLIEHPRGLVLLDAGLRPAAFDGPPRDAYGDAVIARYPLDCPPENRIDRQIEAAGFRVSDVTHVVVSHTHLDHTGGLYLFPDADFYIGEKDLRYAFWPHPAWETAFMRDDLDRARGFTWHLLNEDHDLFGDGTIRILQTPGHTPGHQSLLVKLNTKSFLLTGDAGHTMRNFEGILCPTDLNTTDAIASIDRIKRIAAAEQAQIWVMHDPAQWNEFGLIDQPHQ